MFHNHNEATKHRINSQWPTLWQLSSQNNINQNQTTAVLKCALVSHSTGQLFFGRDIGGR